MVPNVPPPSIVLATLNARYIHASLGLRYLLANMGDLRSATVMREFTIASAASDVVAALLLALDGAAPGEPAPATAAVQIVGFGVYVWNVEPTLAVLRLLRAARPALRVVLGGPEVSHEVDGQAIVALADYVITGWGEQSFAQLCRSLLAGEAPPGKVIVGVRPPLAQIALPYAEYSDADLAHRLLYVEASRGCPFGCEFCLSALDENVEAFALPPLLGELDRLYRRGARNFKFVDRTFNLKIDTAIAILQFFLDRLPAAGDSLFAHFEVIPDRLPERMRAVIARFPAGVLQFEVGVQSFNVEVQQRIARRQDNARSEANLRWLVGQSNAHVHADLIFGLPGETLTSFAQGFDRLHALSPHEIQLGLLKRLRGAPIARHSAEYAMAYDATPPYTVLRTGAVDGQTMLRVARFACYWERVANSGRFARTRVLLLATRNAGDEEGGDEEGGDEEGGVASPFQSFLAFSDWLWRHSGKTCALSPEALVDALDDYLCGACALPAGEVRAALLADYLASGARGSPRALAGRLPRRDAPQPRVRGAAQRQQRHLAVKGG